MNYAKRCYEQKEIVVLPNQKMQAGVSCKLGKRSHGWLRVSDDMGSNFYKLPIENGQFHFSVAAILAKIEKQIASGLSAKFYWERTKSGIYWTDIGQLERDEVELNEYYDKILSEYEEDL